MTKTFAIFTTGKNAPYAKAFESKKAATQNGNGGIYFQTATEFGNIPAIMTSDIVKVYNSLADKPVAKFQDRATAVRRTFDLMNEKLDIINERKHDMPETATTTVKSSIPPKPAKAPKGEGKKGRDSALAGKTLVASAAILTSKENPRRTGTHGHKSMGIIIAAGSAGIKYEDFLSKGGRSVDANWDINKGSAIVKA